MSGNILFSLRNDLILLIIWCSMLELRLRHGEVEVDVCWVRWKHAKLSDSEISVAAAHRDWKRRSLFLLEGNSLRTL